MELALELRICFSCHKYNELIHLVWLKPLNIAATAIEALKSCGNGLVLDSGFEVCGASRSIAYDLTHQTGVAVHALALEDRSSGVAKNLLPPNGVAEVVPE